MTEYDVKRAIGSAKDELRTEIGRLEKARQGDRLAMTEGFNKLAQALLSLTGEVRAIATEVRGLASEVRAMRADLSPQKLDKPRLPGSGFSGDNTG